MTSVVAVVPLMLMRITEPSSVAATSISSPSGSAGLTGTNDRLVIALPV